MLTSTELDELALKVQQVFYADGLADIFMGGILLLLATLILLISHSAFFVVFVIVIFNPIFYKALIDKAKHRWVYPRAGYVKPKPLQSPTRRDNLLGVALILTLLFGPILVLFASFSYPGLIIWMTWVAPVSLSLLISIGPFFVARKYHIYRYYLFAILPPLLGLIIPWLTLSLPSIYVTYFITFAIQLSIVGLIALLSGTILFLRFIHRYPTELTDGDRTNALL
ncbi:MAG: hypothetical protein ACFFDJ_06520 [Candidatus Odinarchaeota archaeon]